ncbi:hypothetical protein ACJX0J_039926, partial [Zea mays]
IISAVAGGITDLSFHVVGYIWQTLKCVLTAAYSLTLRQVMDSAKQVTKSGNLNELSNNNPILQPLPSRWLNLLAMGTPDSPVAHRT